MLRLGGLAALLAVTGWIPATAAAQARASDRTRFLDSTSAVSDDPRRVPRAPGPNGPSGVIVLTGGRVWDGTGQAARLASVVIEGNRIKAILPAGSRTWPDSARVMDAAGMTVMPGLIDLHTHLSYVTGNESQSTQADPVDATLRAVERLRYFIESGITSVRDVASHGTVPFRIKDWVRQRRLIGPRVFAAGKLITGTSGHGAEGLQPGSYLYGAIREASGPDDWREAVREQFRAGADVIKIASHFSPAEVRAAVEEAHALGLKVTADAETFYIDWAVEAGVDIIEHPLPRSDSTIRLMAARGTASVPTLTTYQYIFDTRGGYYGSTSRRFTMTRESNLAMLRRLRLAGVTIGVGTDLVGGWYRHLPGAYITELESLVAGGFTVTEALERATRVSAEILDMGGRLGTLEPGRLADLIVVDGRPDQRLRDLARVRVVVRDGEVVVDSGRIVVAPHLQVPEPGAKRAP